MQNFNLQPAPQPTEQQIDQAWQNWDATSDMEPLQPLPIPQAAPTQNTAPQPRLPRGCVWLGAIALAPVAIPVGIAYIGARTAWRAARGQHAADENVFQQIGHHFVKPKKAPPTPVKLAREDKNVANYNPQRVVVENSPEPRVSRYQDHKIRQSEKYFR